MAEAIGSLVVRIGGDATDLLDSFRRAGKATEDLNSKFGSAVTALKGLAAALEVREMARFITDIAEVEDKLGKMSQKVGITVEALSELKYAANLSDVSLEQLQTGLQQLAKHMQDAQAGTLESVQAFQALGVEVQRGANGPLRATDEVLFQLADKFAGMEDGAGKTALAMRLFGKSGADLIPLLNQGAQGLRDNAEEARKFGLVISTESAKAAEEFNDNMTRLKEIADALARELAGPVIKALGEAGKAFLDAKKDGESFFSSLLEGWRTLVTGNDAYKLNKQIVEATDRFIQAQNALDQARSLAMERGFSKEETDRFVKEYVDAVTKAKAEVDKLIALKPILAPEDQGAQPGANGPKRAAPNLQPTGAADAAEKEAKQIEDAAEEESRVQQEAMQAVVDARNKQLEDEQRVQQQRLQSMYDAIDAEQEAAIQEGQVLIDEDSVSHSTRLQMLSDSLKTREELENEAYQRRLDSLSGYTDAELEALGGRAVVIEEMERQHQENLLRIRGQGQDRVQRLVEQLRKGDVRSALSTFDAITSGLSQHNRQIFELNKASGIAQAIISAYVGISKTLETYPFPLSAAMAAAQAGIAFAQVSAIQSQSFGGGGGAAPSLAGQTAAPPVTPVAQSQPSRTEQVQRIFNVFVNGSSRAVIEEFANGLNSLADEGFQFRLQS